MNAIWNRPCLEKQNKTLSTQRSQRTQRTQREEKIFVMSDFLCDLCVERGMPLHLCNHPGRSARQDRQLPRPEQVQEIGERQRVGEQEILAFVTAELLQQVGLFRAFDAFDGN